MIMLVLPEMIREFRDSCGEERHLDLDRPFVGLVSPVFLDYRRLRSLVQLVGVSWKIRNSNTEQLGGYRDSRVTCTMQARLPKFR